METINVAEQESCLYLYAIVDSYAPVLTESEGTHISLIRFRDIACAATTVSAAEYRSNLPSDRSEQLDWVTPRVMKHHQVLMEMMAHSTVVPFKFGTLCASTEEVRAMLAARYDQFQSLLERLREKEEWVVAINVDHLALLRHIETTEQQLHELDSQIGQKTGGEAYLLRKKKDRFTHALLDDRFQRLQEDCRERLLRFSALLINNPLPTSTEGTDAVVSATVLCHRTEFESLTQVVSQIENDYCCYCASVRLSGPWPAYSSANKWIDGSNPAERIPGEEDTAKSFLCKA